MFGDLFDLLYNTRFGDLFDLQYNARFGDLFDLLCNTEGYSLVHRSKRSRVIEVFLWEGLHFAVDVINLERKILTILLAATFLTTLFVKRLDTFSLY